MPRSSRSTNRLASLTATFVTAFATAAALVVGGPGGPPPALAQDPPTSADRPTWVGTWSAAPNGGTGTDGYAGFTIRNLVHTSVGGDRVRVKLSNAFGTEPVLVEHTTVGVQRLPGSAAVADGTLRDVTFDGSTAVTIPAGAELYSDPVALRLGAAADLFVTTFTPEPSGPVTYHAEGLATSYFATDGTDHAASVDGSALTETTTALHYVTEVDVEPGQSPGAVVTLGDSITDGVGSARDRNRRYPDVLAARLRAEGGDLGRMGVLNAGISGNRVLLDGAGVRATERVDRDVLQRAGASSVIVLLGINDIQQQPHQLDPDKIVAGLRQIARDARDAGLTVIGGTITPFKGWYSYGPEQEATRQAVNDWIRTTDELDAVVDFDETIRDPDDPQRMLPRYDSGDHLHPGEAGLAAMAGAVDLSRLGTPGKVLPGEPAPVERSVGVASSPQSAVAVAGRPAEIGFQVRAVVQKPGTATGTLTTVVDGDRTVTPFEVLSEGRMTQVDLSPTVRVPGDAEPGTRTVRFEIAVEGGGRAVTTSELELVAVGCAQDDDVCPVGLDHDHDSVASAADDRDGNFDGLGWSYAAETLPDAGTTLLAGMAYAFPSGADGDDNTVVADGKTIDLPDLRSDRLHVLAAAGNGSVNETATVTYTDGGTETVSLAFSDWAQGPGSGEHVAVRAPYRLRAGVGRDGPAVHIYGRANELDPSRTVTALTLPDESRLKIFALTLEVATP
ncbi:SGNH/GDSL hydrolase family protein [Promicromonospora aerolata]|uniref:SGNH/GDSL hydrolase family protein n=1 Tax=Promicromonospora aerolata TaxID=195749 RepID=A0ABW4V4D1_9MICO